MQAHAIALRKPDQDAYNDTIEVRNPGIFAAERVTGPRPECPQHAHSSLSRAGKGGELDPRGVDDEGGGVRI